MLPRVRRALVKSARRAAVLGACAVALGACSSLFPDTVQGEVKLVVLKYDADGGSYKLVVDSLKTLASLRTMEGDAARILGGAEIRIDPAEIARANPQSQEALEEIIYRTRGSPVDFAYFTVDGVVHPEDFHSLNIATTYYNFEKAHLFFLDLNAALYQLPVNYFPKLEEMHGGQLREVTDNAYWDPLGRTFAILPFKDIQELPLGMNLGVVAHEYTHAVFSNRVFPRDDGIPWLYRRALEEPEKWNAALNLNRSLNEGLADFFGAAISGDPGFIRKSLSPIQEARRLDPEAPRCLTPELEEALETASHDSYDPYALGNVLAAALWEAVAQRPDRMAAFSRGLTDGMFALGETFTAHEDTTSLADGVEAIASNLVADLKPRACGLLLDRLGLTEAQVPSCADAQPPERRCR